jgi:hypothetical protein
VLKKLSAALAVVFALASLSVAPSRADDMTQTLSGMNPQSTWINQNSRDNRISDGTYRWQAFGSNQSDPGHYAGCVTTPSTGLFVAVTTSGTFTNCSVFQLLPESPSALGGFPSGNGTFLPADNTKIELQAILPAGTSTAAIGPMGVGASSGQSVSNLIECQVTISDVNSQPISIVSSTGIVTSTVGNRDRVDRPTCQSKASASATSPTTPTVDSGFVAISAVVVPFGTATVTSGMVSAQTAQQFFGFFAASGTGITALDTSNTAQAKSGPLSFAGIVTFAQNPVGPGGHFFLDSSSAPQTKTGALTVADFTAANLSANTLGNSQYNSYAAPILSPAGSGTLSTARVIVGQVVCTFTGSNSSAPATVTWSGNAVASGAAFEVNLTLTGAAGVTGFPYMPLVSGKSTTGFTVTAFQSAVVTGTHTYDYVAYIN